MNKLHRWQKYSVGVLGLVLAAWVGSATAAQWANPDLLVSPDIVKHNDELRKLAAARLAHEQPGQTLQKGTAGFDRKSVQRYRKI